MVFEKAQEALPFNPRFIGGSGFVRYFPCIIWRNRFNCLRRKYLVIGTTDFSFGLFPRRQKDHVPQFIAFDFQNTYGIYSNTKSDRFFDIKFFYILNVRASRLPRFSSVKALHHFHYALLGWLSHVVGPARRPPFPFSQRWKSEKFIYYYFDDYVPVILT